MQGGGEQFRVGSTGGVNWRSGSAFASFDYLDANPLSLSDRSFIDLSVASGEATLSNENESFSFLGSIKQDITNRISFSVDLISSSRNTISRGSGFGVASDSESKIDVNSFILNSQLTYELSDQIIASIFIDYAEEESSRIDLLDPSAESVDQKNSLYTLEAQLSGTAFNLPAGNLGFAFGVLHRVEENEAFSSNPAIPESLNADRDVSAVYGELLLPLVGPEMAFALGDRVDISVAGRYVDYSDFGSNFSPKLGLSWILNDELGARLTYSESFRAPSLRDTAPVNDSLAANLLPSSLFTGLPPQDPRLPAGTAAALIVGGAGSLSEETAEIWSTGFEYEPSWLPGLRLEASYFDIEYTDRIETVRGFDAIFNPTFSSLLDIDPSSERIGNLLELPQFRNFLPFEPTADDFDIFIGPLTVNLSRRDISGFDLIGSYERETRFGSLNTSFNLTHIDEYLAQLTSRAPAIDEVGSLYRPSALRLRSTTGLDYNGISGSITLNYTDEGATSIDSWLTVDLSLAYAPEAEVGLFVGSRISLAVRNAFDEDPPFVGTTIDGLNFDSANANPFGRVVSLQLRKAF